jgi:hypothetical protein
MVLLLGVITAVGAINAVGKTGVFSPVVTVLPVSLLSVALILFAYVGRRSA